MAVIDTRENYRNFHMPILTHLIKLELKKKNTSNIGSEKVSTNPDKN